MTGKNTQRFIVMRGATFNDSQSNDRPCFQLAVYGQAGQRLFEKVTCLADLTCSPVTKSELGLRLGYLLNIPLRLKDCVAFTEQVFSFFLCLPDLVFTADDTRQHACA